MKLRITAFLFAFCTLPFTIFAQTVPEKAPDALEQIMVPDGKIYVVLGVVLIIWFAVLFFLFRTDRKLDKLEKELNNQ